jgi:FkbM family methyltransferase
MSHPPSATYGYDWSRFVGTDAALRWNRRDLSCVDTVLKMVPGRTAAIQAGGNLGIFGKYLARTFQTVYVFEPSPEQFPLMVKNAPEPNIVRFQAALGCTRELVGTSQTRRDQKTAPPHEGVTHVSGAGVVPTLCIDDLNLPVCDLLYLDVEGYELYALIGAVSTLDRCRPVVSVEMNGNAAHYGLTTDQTGEYLERHGYRYAVSLQSDRVFVPVERVS